MCWLRWPCLPLLTITFLLAPNTPRAIPLNKKQKIYAEALLSFKSAVGNPQQLSSWVGKYPCSRPWMGIGCSHRVKDTTIVSLKLTGLRLEGFIAPSLQNLSDLMTLWLDDNYLKGPIPVELGHLKELSSLRLSGNSLCDNLPLSIAALPNLKELTLANNHLTGSLPLEGVLMKIPHLSLHGNYGLCSLNGMLNLPVCDSLSSAPTMTSLQTLDYFKSMETREAAMFGRDPGVPILTPLAAAAARRPRKPKLAAIIGAIVCAALIVAIIVAIVYMCLIRAKKLSRRRSETGSSESSPQVEWAREEGSPSARVLPPDETQGLRQLTLAELDCATSNFSQNNIIGEGGFGLVYKGLLEDGSIVAIKQRFQGPSQHFIQQVAKIGLVQHKNLVRLLGYCQEHHQQFLIYEYICNGTVGHHLYDAKGLPVGRLEIRQRLSIALDAARGLDYLHGLTPPLLHMHFRTSNVLVDDKYMAMVADFGLSKLLVGDNRAGSSSGFDCFLDPELSTSNGFSQTTDVYAFGVFLLELISGREAVNWNESDSGLNLVEQAKATRNLEDILDKTLGENAMQSMQKMLELALRCLATGSMRPTMDDIFRELEKLHYSELNWQQTSGTGEEIGTVTLGSELFT